MKITIVTLFPEMFDGPFDHSIIRLAKEKGKLEVTFVNIRDFGIGKHRIVDDKPYGGGDGMVMRVDVLTAALEKAKCKKNCKEYSILLDPKGSTFQQEKAKTLTAFDHIILVSTRYEGVDERFRGLVDAEISIGDYVLTGGEIPAMVLTDAIIRLLPGVLGKDTSSQNESFEGGLLEYPQYTRPEVFKTDRVPAILMSGDHEKIQDWRGKQALLVTKKKRPDLLTAQ